MWLGQEWHLVAFHRLCMLLQGSFEAAFVMYPYSFVMYLLYHCVCCMQRCAWMFGMSFFPAGWLAKRDRGCMVLLLLLLLCTLFENFHLPGHAVAQSAVYNHMHLGSFSPLLTTASAEQTAHRQLCSNVCQAAHFT